MSTSGTIAVDLDGTLARYDGWKGIDHIGDPIPLMVSRVMGAVGGVLGMSYGVVNVALEI